MFLQTEHEFTLPRGYVDAEGNLHRRGVMRLATALDEIEACRDAKARGDADLLPVMLISRVLVRLEGVASITPEVIGGLFSADFSFLQDMYETVNSAPEPVIQVRCPHCGKDFTDTLNFALGE